jgi:hypothetical protein
MFSFVPYFSLDTEEPCIFRKLFILFVYNIIYIAHLFEFEVKTADILKKVVLWDIMSCSPMKVTQRFVTTYRFHQKGRRVSQAGNQHEACLPQ